MSREIDERLVAMKFDNAQFESGVKESLASLAALREGLELDGAADSFEDVFKASEKYLDFKEPTKAVGGLSTALSKVGSVARSAFSTFTAPIKAVSSMVQGLYGDVSRLFGLDIAYKMEQSAIKTFQAFTTEPLSTGFQEYETKVDSLKAIMNSTAEAYTEKLRKQSEDEYKTRETAFKQQLKGKKLSTKEKKDALEKFKLENDVAYAAKKRMDEQLKASKKEYEEKKKALELEAKQNKLSKEERDKRLKSLLSEKEERDGLYTKQYKEVKDNRYAYDEDAHRKIVEDKIEELNKYADRTIYSFSDMMQALPTLTNMGVEIDTAVSVVKGLHNLAAIAGKGATEAKRALYNLGDAFSMGHFESKDWKTMEYAGLATPQFKKIAIEMAARNGSLIEKNGKYFAKKVSEKGVEKLYEVTTETFKDTLQYDWFDKTAMENAFKVLSGDLTELDLLKMGFDKKADADTIKYFLDLGKQAMEAAQQVRTFTKMMDSLKEAAQSGWSKTYELLFGTDKEAIDFWSPINTAISGILDRSSEARNSVLEAWSKSTLFISGEFVSTRNAIRDSIIRIVEMFDLFKNSIRTAWNYAFGKIDSKALVNLTKRIADLTVQWKNWLGDKTDKNSNITKITNALKGFFSVIRPIIGSIKDVFSWIASKVSPVAGKLFEKITKFGDDLRLKFRGTKNLKEVFDVIKSSATGNVKKALDWLSELMEKISSKWQEIQNWYNGSSLKGIVDNVFGYITGFFSAPDDEDETKGGFDRMIGWIIDAKDTIAAKFEEVKTWWNSPDNKLHSLASNVWDEVIGFFKAPENEEGEKSGVEKTLEWLTSTWESIQNWSGWSSISNFIGKDGVGGKISSGLNSLFEAIMKILQPNLAYSSAVAKPGLDKAIANGGATDVAFEGKDTVVTKFKSFVETMKEEWDAAKEKVTELLADIPTTIENFRKTLSKFFGGDGDDSWGGIIDLATDKAAGIGKISLLFSGASALGGFGKLLAGAGSLAKNLGKSAKTLSQKHVPFGEVFGEFFKRLSTPFATFFDPENKKSIGEWISNFKPFGEVASNYTDTTKKIKNFALAALEFAGAIWIMVDAVTRIAELSKDTTVDWGMATAVLGGLATVVTAFEFIGSMTEGKVTGLFGFAIAIETMLLAVKQIATMGSNGVDFDSAMTVLMKLTALISAFEFVSKLSDVGYAGASIGLKGKSTGLLGFVVAIEGLILAIKQIAELGKEVTFDNVLGVLDHLVILIGAFEAVSKLSGINSWDGSSVLFNGKSTGLIGFVIAIEGMIDSIRRIAELKSDDNSIEYSIQIIDKLAFLIGKFELLSKLSKIDLGGFGGSLSLGLNGKASGLLGFTFAIRELVNSVGKIAGNAASSEKINAAVTVIDKLGWMIDKFQVFSGIRSFALGAAQGLAGDKKLSSSSGLIGFILAIGSLVNTLSFLTKLDVEKANKGVEILGSLTTFIDSFIGVKALGEAATSLQGFSGMSGKAMNVGKVIDFVSMEGFVGSLILLVNKVADLSKDTDINVDQMDAVVSVFDTVSTIMLKLSGVISSFEIVSTLSNKFGSGSSAGSWAMGIKAITNILEFVGIAGAALWGIGAALEAAGVTDEQLQDVADTIHKVNPVVNAVVTELGDMLGSFGGQIAGSAVGAFDSAKLNKGVESLDEAVTNVSSISDEDLEKLKTSVAVLNEINETLPNKTFWEWITGSKMENFGSGMSSLGTGLANFYNGISTIADWEQFNSATTAMHMLMDAAARLATAAELSNYGDPAYDLLQFFGTLSDMESGFSMTPGDIDSFVGIEDLWKTFGANVAGSFLAGVQEKATELSTIISESIDTAPVITPVLDLTQFNADLLRLNQAVPGRFMFNLGGGAIANPASADWNLINEITKANEAAQENMAAIMSSGLSNIVAAISGVSVTMDGYSVGQVVTPYVDANISATLARYLRNINRQRA